MANLPIGEYKICACGLSAKKPFCDGSHETADCNAEPQVLTVTKRTGLLWLCTCGQSKRFPHCDGTHNRL